MISKNRKAFLQIPLQWLFLFLCLPISNCAGTEKIQADNFLTEKTEFLKNRLNQDGLIISFKIPPCDPISKSNLKTRSFTYDVALSAIIFKMLNQSKLSEALLLNIEKFVSQKNGIDFSYDSHTGPLGIQYIRSGAVAWLGYAFVYLNQLKPAQKLAQFILSRRVHDPDDPRNGLVLGGFGQITEKGFIEKEIEWVSTEHNIDIYFFLRDLSLKLNRLDPKRASIYAKTAREIKNTIVQKLWDKRDKRFYRGISNTGVDREKVLDTQTWGALFLGSIGFPELAKSALVYAKNNFLSKGQTIRKELKDSDRFNCQYHCPNYPLIGFKPYLESLEYKKPPNLIWAEGTYGYLLASRRLKLKEPAVEQSIQQFERCSFYGGVLQTTETRNSMPYEFHVWESTSSTVWSLFYYMDDRLSENSKLWATDHSLGF